ncbi:MAG: zinc ribbon domain-containing protein [Sphingobium sp.]
MAQISSAPDIAALEIPVDGWTTPFWAATAEHRLTVPCCSDCETFRWPPGPFCPHCQSQSVDWVDPGAASLYSYTIMPEGERTIVAALVEFAGADGVRLLSSLVDVPLDRLTIGAALRVDWIAAADATVPVFRLA